ncbi:hypothetical protein KUC_1380 [Vreelandella boliviensis LC1]|uniref:Uncharacterized protein n=1 Tax=Vreelandella boliviensis LC1 TaxID=1072583 RepID=A0A7U9C6P4_9GAMM|nr:hypothetical protein KUC_1380 [Halomonas boliviensis LC1]
MLTGKDTQQLANSHAPREFPIERLACIEMEQATFAYALLWCNSHGLRMDLPRLSAVERFLCRLNN